MPYEIVWEVSDESGDDASWSLNVPDTGFAQSDYNEFGAAYAELADAIIGGVISGGTLQLTADTSGITGNVTDASADVQDKGKFEFVTAQGRRVKMQLPCISENLVAAGTDDLDQTNPAVAALIAAMENGISVTGGTISPCNVAEEDITNTLFSRRGATARQRRR